MVGCLTYELSTGEYLFDISEKSSSYDKNKDHLFQMYELFGKISKEYLVKCAYSNLFFDQKCRILKYKQFDHVSIEDILISEFNFEQNDATQISEFIGNMLIYDPKLRFDCQKCLNNKWLN